MNVIYLEGGIKALEESKSLPNANVGGIEHKIGRLKEKLKFVVGDMEPRLLLKTMFMDLSNN